MDDMKADSEANESRREFFQQTVRRMSLAGLSAVAVWFDYRRQISTTECVNKELCHDCSELGSCELPSAIRAKSESKEAT